MKNYYITQKLVGLISVAIGILVPVLCNGDATFSVFALSLGIYLMITKEKCIIDLEGDQGENTQK